MLFGEKPPKLTLRRSCGSLELLRPLGRDRFLLQNQSKSAPIRVVVMVTVSTPTNVTLITVGLKVVVRWLVDMAKEKAEETSKAMEKEKARRVEKERAEEEEAGLKGTQR